MGGASSRPTGLSSLSLADLTCGQREAGEMLNSELFGLKLPSESKQEVLLIVRKMKIFLCNKMAPIQETLHVKQHSRPFSRELLSVKNIQTAAPPFISKRANVKGVGDVAAVRSVFSPQFSWSRLQQQELGLEKVQKE